MIFVERFSSVIKFSHISSQPFKFKLIVITVYLPSCLGQETAKGPFGLQVKLPPPHLSTTHGGDLTLSLLMLNVKQESCENQFFYSFWFGPIGNRTRVYRFSSRRSIHSTTDRLVIYLKLSS